MTNHHDDLLKKIGEKRLEEFGNTPNGQLMKAMAGATADLMKKFIEPRDLKISALQNELEETRADVTQLQMDNDILRGRINQLEAVLVGRQLEVAR